MQEYYSYVVDTLELFRGKLSIDDIYHHTYKELYYLRNAEVEYQKRNPTPQLSDIL